MKAAFALWMGWVAWTGGPDPCTSDNHPEPITLEALWLEGATHEPGFRAAALRIASSERRQVASQRARFPQLGIDGVSNYGQRVSPGEERVLGVGPRSELRLLGEWIWLDPERGGLRTAVGLENQAVQAEEAFRTLQWQASRGYVYTEAVWVEARVQALEVHQALLDLLRSPVEMRVEMGVESSFDARRLTDALAQTARLLEDARARQSMVNADLSHLVGRCVRPVVRGPHDQDGARTHPDAAEVGAPDGVPEVLALRARAQAMEARATADAGRWQVGLTGSVGPTRSRAFSPDPVEMESLVGVVARLRLDPAGQFRQQREAGRLEARALAADAEQRAVDLARESDRLEAERLQIESTLRGLAAEREARSEALNAALLRWDAGVGGWAELVQAAEEALDHAFLWLDAERSYAELGLRRLELGLATPDPSFFPWLP